MFWGDQKLLVENLGAEAGKALLADDSKASRSLTEYEKACALMESMMKGPSGAQEARNDEVKRTVYVGNLSKHCTPQHLRDEFSQIGEVVYIKFSGNCSRGKLKRFCRITVFFSKWIPFFEKKYMIRKAASLFVGKTVWIPECGLNRRI